MNTTWLSVIVPTYNGAAYLADALESLLSQIDDQTEVLVVDDGSTDDTVTILNTYSNRMPLRIIRRKHLGNWVANSNYALSSALGRFVCFLHQDDLWLPERLSILKRVTTSVPNAALYVHPVRYLDALGEDVGPWNCPLPAGTLSPRVVIERLLVQNFIAMPAPLFPREKALEVGGLNESLWYTADWDFWLKLAAMGPTVYVPRALAAFRIHGNSQTAQWVSRAEEMRRQIEFVLNQHLPRWEATSPTFRSVRAVARLAVEINFALAALAHGQRPTARVLAERLLMLDWDDCYRLLRDSRILERVLARVRAYWVPALLPLKQA